jgi:hypothetical protein
MKIGMGVRSGVRRTPIRTLAFAPRAPPRTPGSTPPDQRCIPDAPSGASLVTPRRTLPLGVHVVPPGVRGGCTRH